MTSYSNNYNPYSTTSYGANGATGGGGFYGGGGTGSAFGDAGVSSSPGSASKRSGGNTLRPVTIKQILDAQQAHPDAEFRIDGQEISQLTFVAIIRNVATQSTNITYRVEDGTGMIDVKQWIDADEGDKNSELLTDTYVRIYGQLKSFHNKRHIGAHHIRAVTDHNEVIYHLLEATYVHLFNTRGGVDGDTSYKKETGAMEGVIPTGPANGNSELDRLEPLQKQIMLFVHSVPDTNEGVHVQTIAQAVRQPSAAVMQAVEVLSTDGLLYTTIDDDHVKSTLNQ